MASGFGRATASVVAAVVAAALTLALALPAGTAWAAFPGVNAQIAFTTDRDGNQEIYGMSFDGTGQTNLTSNAAADYQAAFSPDGSTIAFVSERDGNPEIYTMKADGTGLLRLTDDPAADTDPAWSANGTRIYFASDRGGNQDVYSMAADGSGVLRLTDDPGKDYGPVGSPDGKSIAFVSERDANPEIYTMAPDGTGQKRLTNNQATDTHPDWAPDGQSLVFATDRDANFEVYSMKVDGSTPTNLTNSSTSADTNPVYAPGGNWILFDSDRTKNVDVWALPVQKVRSGPSAPAREGGGPQPIDLTKGPKSLDSDATQGAWTPVAVLDQDLKEAIAGLGSAPHKKTIARVHGIQADLSAVIGGFPDVGGVGFGKLFGQLNGLSSSLNAVVKSKDPLGKAKTKTKARLQHALAAAKALAAEDGLGSDATAKFQNIAGTLDKTIANLDKGTLKIRSFLGTVHDLRNSFQDALALLPKVQGAAFNAVFGSLGGLNKAVHQALAVHTKDKKFVDKLKADLGTALSIEQRFQGQLNSANRP
ncbi:MAG: LpqB family beta-propeller domain-containing protein [Actinomycetota bacterium]|nr:LpqB family beta-propeller domain-containing protein [Actinomycetota bacterium]